MSYDKQTWQSGDVITAAKMNHIEDGIAAGGVFIVNATHVLIETDKYQYQLDKTYNQIYSAIMQGKVCYVNYGEDERLCVVEVVEHYESNYVIFDLYNQYIANSADSILVEPEET